MLSLQAIEAITSSDVQALDLLVCENPQLVLQTDKRHKTALYYAASQSNASANAELSESSATAKEDKATEIANKVMLVGNGNSIAKQASAATHCVRILLRNKSDPNAQARNGT